MRFKLLVAIVFINTAFSFAQSGWTQKKGKYYVKVSGQNTQSSQYFNQLGEKTKSDELKTFTLGAYAEYGQTDKLTIIGFVPIYTSFSRPENSTKEENKVFESLESVPIGDPEISAKLGLFKTKWVSTALTGKLRIPLAGGEANQGLTLSAGFPLFKSGDFSTYGNVYGGANNRTKKFSDEWRYGFEFGVGYKNKWWLFLKQDSINSMENVDIDLETEILN